MSVETSPDEDPLADLVRQENVPDLHGVLSRANAEFVAAVEDDLDTLVSLERVRRSHGPEWLAACRVAAESGGKTRLLRYLALHEDGYTASYEELAEVTGKSKRTVRAYTSDLREDGLVTVEDIGHAVVGHASTATYLLVNEAFRLAEQ